MKFSQTCVVLWVGLLAVGCSDYDSASRAYRAGRYDQAAKAYEVLAQAGDVRAQFDLSHMRFSGVGGARDDLLAWRWLLSSANGGHPPAMVEVGRRYALGLGVEKNVILAVRWYRRAAHVGEALAAFNLAALYESGEELPKDRRRAYAWYVVASKLGNRAAAERVTELGSKMAREDIDRADALARQLEQDPEA